MNFLSEGVMKKISLIAAAAIFAAGCAGGSDKENNELPSYYTDLQYRDSVLLAEGMIHYGNDPDARSFDDIYYAFAARDKWISNTCPIFIREGTPNGFNTISKGRPFGKYGISSTGSTLEITPLLP